jgi:hypothetical protein
VGVILLAVGPLLSTSAQDGTLSPTPDLTLSPEPVAATLNDPTVMALPFGDTFDTNCCWQPVGAWHFDPDTAYEGGGWFAEGAVRELVSTLEYTMKIDLSGTLSAQVVYRQKANLPPSDFVALDLSLDGGHSWIMADQQIGLQTDWDLHIVDLTDYRGQVIRLRFRLNTGVTVPGESENINTAATEDAAPAVSGYWIDNLAIQYVMVPPAFVAIDTGPRTLMGLHLTVGARSEPIVDLVKRLNAIGWPLGSIKGTTGTESILNEVKTLSPQTVVIYRSLTTPLGMRDCPDTSRDPVAEAQIWVTGQQMYWRGVRADYYELMNECLPPAEWLVPFSIEAMRLAGSQGECLLLFSFSTGNPDPAFFDQLTPVYDYALKNPCQAGRYHGIALHAYGYNPATLVSESGISLGFRHRLFYSYVLSKLPEAIQVPVYLTEVGPGNGSTQFKCTDITRDVIQYTQQLEYDPYIRGFEWWNFGSQGQWVDDTECLPAIGDALVNYYAARPR